MSRLCQVPGCKSSKNQDVFVINLGLLLVVAYGDPADEESGILLLVVANGDAADEEGVGVIVNLAQPSAVDLALARRGEEGAPVARAPQLLRQGLLRRRRRAARAPPAPEVVAPLGHRRRRIRAHIGRHLRCCLCFVRPQNGFFLCQ